MLSIKPQYTRRIDLGYYLQIPLSADFRCVMESWAVHAGRPDLFSLPYGDMEQL